MIGRPRSLLPPLLAALFALARAASAASAAEDADLRVSRVLDGDTVVLADGREVRYLGINAPEAGEPFSTKARELNRRLVEGQPVRVVPGPTRRDRYGRILGYVYAGGRFVNAEILRAGFAHLFFFEPGAEEAALTAAEDAARRAGSGIWGPAGPRGPLRITAPRGVRDAGAPPPRFEAMTMCNISPHPIDLTGYVLEAAADRFRFPSATLERGRVAFLLAKEGRDRLTGPGPLRFHWPGSRHPGVLALRAPGGRIVDRVALSSGVDHRAIRRPLPPRAAPAR
jgi:micrococcal nuclease